MLHEQIRQFYNGFRRDAHPMAVMCGVVGALSAFYHDSLDIHVPASRTISAFRMIAKMPTIAAWGPQAQRRPAIRLSAAQRPRLRGELPLHVPRGAGGDVQGQPDPGACDGPDHDPARGPRAERVDQHGFGWPGRPGPTRSPASPRASPAWWGPAHGGANEAVLKMLAEIGHVKNIPAFLSEVKDKGSHTKLRWVSATGCTENLRPAGEDHPEGLPRGAGRARHQGRPASRPGAGASRRSRSTTSRFVDRKLYPNVDFYSGIILKAMGFPTSMFTALFCGIAHGRLGSASAAGDDRGSGAAHRPAAADLHQSAPQRDYIPIAKRG